MSTEPHPLYPERETVTIALRGQEMPGWFTGPAALWTGGAEPRVIGPFDGVAQAQQFMSTNPGAAGAQIFPISTVEEFTALPVKGD